MWFCEECVEINHPTLVSCSYCGTPGHIADGAVQWVLLKTMPVDVAAILEFLMQMTDPFRWFEIDWEKDWTEAFGLDTVSTREA